MLQKQGFLGRLAGRKRPEEGLLNMGLIRKVSRLLMLFHLKQTLSLGFRVPLKRQNSKNKQKEMLNHRESVSVFHDFFKKLLKRFIVN